MEGPPNIRLLIINQSFYPDFEATGQYMTELAEDLIGRGFEISVLTGQSQKASSFEVYKGIQIHRCFQTRFHKKRLFGRYLNYLSLFASFLWQGLFLPKVDVILLGSSPPFLYVIGIMIAFVKRAKLVYCVKDLYPDIAVELGLLKNRTVISLLEGLAKLAYRFSDKIVVIGSYMQAKLLARGASPEKLVLIHDWADADDIVPIKKEQTEFYAREKDILADRFIIQYSGNMGMAHDFETVLSAAEILQANRPKILFVFIGDGVQKKSIQELAKKRSLRNIVFYPYQARDFIKQSLNTCDLSLVTMKLGFEGLIIPCKIYGILAVGKPVIFVGSEDSEIGQIILKNDCGYVVALGDTKGFVSAVERLYNDHQRLAVLGQKARRVLETSYTRELGVEKYYRLLKAL